MRLDTIPFPWEQFRRQTVGWSKELVGTLLVLWIHQWADNGIAADNPRALSHVLGESRVESNRLWKLMHGRFQKDKDGLYRDAELEAIRRAELERIWRASDHGRRGADARWQKAKGGAYKKTSAYRRGVAIAHQLMDQMPHADWNVLVEEFKLVAGQQGIDYMERGGRSKSPLYMRCLEWVDGEKKRRKERGQEPWRKRQR